MIVLTVKTLDSQNHSFTVDDDITVQEFKVKIAESINIPPETQRIIYCGRVLRDNAKLSEYDVNGKVVHLVQRPPPGANPTRNRSPSPPQPQRRGFRGFDHGNTMYLGSMAFPSNLMESQGILPPPPSHSLSRSRLNVAKRMIKRAEAVIRLLESPPSRANEQPPPEEPQEEEITPIIEARVIVPSNDREPIDEEMVLSAVQNTLNADISTTSDNFVMPSQSTSDTPPTEEGSASSTPDESTPVSASTENLAADQQQPPSERPNRSRENASRTREMADLLTMLSQLQTRFAPFLDRYHTFMTEDPVVPSENITQTQTMLNRVSEVFHLLGHAYHSLSDIMISVRSPPPRPLLCRPILIQHSAVVQAGIPIPIQVEAQFNLAAEPAPSAPVGASANAQANNPTAPPSAGGTANVSSSTNNTNAEERPQVTSSNGPTISAQFQPTVVGFPFVPAASMRVQQFPFQIRTAQLSANLNSGGSRTQNNNNNNTARGGQSGTGGAASAVTAPPPTTTGGATGTTAATTTASSASDGGFNFNNPNVEFFMEVTPEVMGDHPPELLQSLMQMASQYINMGNVTISANGTRVAPSNQTPPSTTATESNQSSQDATQSTSNVTLQTGQNSQARGNTQTNPTTATHTRSTPRPHVHLAQQAMQGGFDPFLPCNSHHVPIRGHTHDRLSRNRSNQSASGNAGQSAAQAGGGTATATSTANATTQNLSNVINGLMNTLRTAAFTHIHNMQEPDLARAAGAADTGATSGSRSSSSSLSLGGNFEAFLRSNRTIAEMFPDIPIPPGESIISDLVMIFSRHLRIIDMFNIHNGNLESLNRVIGDIQSFFTNRILDGSNTPENVDRGVDRIINEMRPFLESFAHLSVRNNIDIVRSIELLFRARLPDLILIGANFNSNNVRDFVDQCAMLTQYMCALALFASSNGSRGVEQIFRQFVANCMQGMSANAQHLAISSINSHLFVFLEELDVPNNEIEPYVVSTPDLTMPIESEMATEQIAQNRQENEAETEPMELDAQATSSPESENLFSSNVGLNTETIFNQIPEHEWAPIIARDVQRQRRQSPQRPFSDAYLSGMPSKRRKIINSTKPQGSLPQVISESVKRAITATGLASVAPLETVAQAAGTCPEIQTAYRNFLRTNVQTNLRGNEDFTPDRFPNASNYFNNQ